MNKILVVFLVTGLLLVFQNCSPSSTINSGHPFASSPDLSFFVDATAGSDLNTGVSASNPWKTLAQVAVSNFTSGATVYLKRGEVWNEQLTIPSSNMKIDAYGAGSLPQINGAKTLAANWVSEGGGIYSQSVNLGSNEILGNISENDVLMNFLTWNANAGTTFALAASGTYSFDYSHSKIYILPTGSPVGKTYAASVKAYGIKVESLSDISINNVAITRFSLHGVQFKNCLRCSIKNSTITSGGGAVISTNPSGPSQYLYAGNGIEFGNSSSSGVVDSVTISQIFDSCITPQTYSSGQSASNFVFQNSSLDRCGFAGLEISVLSNGGSTGSAVNGVSAAGLTITNSGKGFSGRRYETEGIGIRIVADAGAGTMSGINIQTSLVSGSAGDGVKLSGEVGPVNLSRLSLSGNGYGINVTDSSSTTLKLNLSSSLIFSNSSYGIYFNAPAAAGFSVLQNTFYNNTTINFGIFNQAGSAKLLNNIFYSTGAMTHVYVGSTLAGASVNNNCYNNVANMFGYNGAAYSTVAAFKSATGFEASGAGGIVGLTNPASGDFTLQAGSQCRGLGSSAGGIFTDYVGAIFASPPSSGAYEFH